MPGSEDLHLGSGQIGKSIDGAFNFQLLRFVASVDPGSVPADTAPTIAVTVAGVKAGDLIIGWRNPNTQWDDIYTVPQRIAADDTVSLKLVNPSAIAVNPPAADITVTVLRPVPFA